MTSLNLEKPHLIVVVGIPGAGKTFFARQFSDAFNVPYLRSQDLFEFSDSGAQLELLWDYILDVLLRTNQTVIIEGLGATRIERQELTMIAKQYGYDVSYIWIQTETITARTRATKGNGKYPPEFPIGDRDFDEAVSMFEPLVAPDVFVGISGKHMFASQAKNVLTRLSAAKSIATKPAAARTPRAKTTRKRTTKVAGAKATTATRGRGRVKIK